MVAPAGQLEFLVPTNLLDNLGRRIVDWGTSDVIDARVAALQAQLSNPQTALNMGIQEIRDAVRSPGTLNLTQFGAGAGAAAVAPYRGSIVLGTVLAGIFVGAVGAMVWRRRS